MRRFNNVLLVILTGAASLLLIAGGWAYLVSSRRLSRVYQVPRPTLAPGIVGDTARGRHLVTSVTVCIICHGSDLGGQQLEGGAALHLVAPNLTQGRSGAAARLDYDGLALAIRHGVRPDGTSLLVMPATAYAHLSDADVASIIAYLRTAPPVDRQLERAHLKPLGRVFVALGRLNPFPAERIEHVRPPAIEPGAEAEGRYLAVVSGCTHCHLATFAGRTKPMGAPGSPIPPRIDATALARWSAEDFARAVRTGVRPDGRIIDRFMPWLMYSGMTDAEVGAIWRYIQSLSEEPLASPRRHN